MNQNEFEHYSLAELNESLGTIDKEKYPLNYQILLKAIEFKNDPESKPKAPKYELIEHPQTKTIRTNFNLGLILAILGMVNLFTGLNTVFTTILGQTIGVALDRGVAILMISAGIWFLSK